MNAENPTVVTTTLTPPAVKPKRKYTKRKKTGKRTATKSAQRLRNAKPTQRTRIITMLDSGLTVKQVQALVGCSLQTIYDVKYKYNREHPEKPLVITRSKYGKAKPKVEAQAKPQAPASVSLTWRQRITALLTGRV